MQRRARRRESDMMLKIKICYRQLRACCSKMLRKLTVTTKAAFSAKASHARGICKKAGNDVRCQITSEG